MRAVGGATSGQRISSPSDRKRETGEQAQENWGILKIRKRHQYP